jgi:hypothetical protein
LGLHVDLWVWVWLMQLVAIDLVIIVGLLIAP